MRALTLTGPVLALLAALATLAGCAVSPPPSAVDRDFGVAYRLAIFGQIANLDAPEAPPGGPAAPGHELPAAGPAPGK